MNIQLISPYRQALLLGVALMHLLISGCSAETSLSLLNAVVSDDHYNKTADIVYGDNPRQRMDLYIPKSDNTTNSESGFTVVFVFGGAWRSGSKGDYEFIAAALTRKGHRVLIPDYRLHPEVIFPEFITDVAAAIAVYERTDATKLYQSSNAQRQQIVLMGHSSGAHQVALLFTDKQYLIDAEVESKVSALIAISGPYDLPLDLDEVSQVFPQVEDEMQVNPVRRVEAMSADAIADVPVLLMHGVEDERVGLFHTSRFADALEQANAAVTVKTLDGGHAGAIIAIATPLRFLNDSLVTVTNFLDALSIAK